MTPHRKIRSSPAEKEGLSRPVQGGLYAAALVLLPLLAVVGGDGFREFLDFGTGVLALVSLTASVAWAIVATDRLFLTPRQRLLAQGIHRGTAVASLGFLLLHGTVKVSLGHVELIGALIPFGLGVTGSAGLIGFGSLAGLLMVVAASTGALRSTLAGRGAIAARWRPLHMLAYPAWCAALVHGLYAGRPADGWVTGLYCLALLGVAVAVSVRLLPEPLRQRLADQVLTLAGNGPDGAPASPRARGRGRARRDLATEPLPGATGVAYAAAESPRPHPYEPEPRVFDGVSRPLQAEARAFAAPGAEARTAKAPYDGGSRADSRTVGGGISAGYRAVSRGGGAGPDVPAAAPAGSDDRTQPIPFAERVPMTEELPVIDDEPSVRPGYWPTPSPPPPAQSPSASTRAYTPFGDPASGPTGPVAEQSPASATYNITEPPAGPDSGPFLRPATGEPWTAPAGDRP
ncbi:hypothetical protein I3F58_20760 [Streptomyces sp. MUM 203J]|uniref:ferric reductase-like transmembrane domain-containing protein n=1 Tax=Streptomyces sp. MUM 203J TaxID=2791990 RepID=UPI001F037F9B|nr:ferric reductase-like transmembrane domain-containing protein [Streptomyces sp. MUM 203J]MCH0541955.1 hypothetical protein [Streptomyces sp. MUM 203J]